MPRLELFPFRFRDPLSGKWVRARYVAERREIAARYAEYEITGPPEIRDVDAGARYFNPLRDERRTALIGNVGQILGVSRPCRRQPRLVAGIATQVALLRVGTTEQGADDRFDFVRRRPGCCSTFPTELPFSA